MKTIDLSIGDRLLITHLLPPMGSRIQMVLIRDLVQQLEFTPAEIEEFSIQDLPDNSGITYNNKVHHVLSVDVSTAQLEILKTCMNLADQRGVFTAAVLELDEQIDRLLAVDIIAEAPEPSPASDPEKQE